MTEETVILKSRKKDSLVVGVLGFSGEDQSWIHSGGLRMLRSLTESPFRESLKLGLTAEQIESLSDEFWKEFFREPHSLGDLLEVLE